MKHFSDRTVVCTLLRCASRLQGWMLSRGWDSRFCKTRFLYTLIQLKIPIFISQADEKYSFL